jgi:hypothetical protein
MNMIIVKSGIMIAILLILSSIQGCFGLQRAAGCNNPGLLGCKDKGPEPSVVEQSPVDLKRAPPGGRPQWAPADGCRYLEGHEHPWSRLLDNCMAAGWTRTECFSSLPPDMLEQFESWEAEKALERGRKFQQRSRQPSLGVEPVDQISQD